MLKILNRILLISILFSSLMTLSACNKPPFMKGMGGVPVESIVINSVPIIQSSVYQATLISRHSVMLQPQVTGQISGIYVKAGEHVKEGQLLVIIDKRKQEAALNSSRAEAESSKAAISQAESLLYTYLAQKTAIESNLTLNKKLYDRYTALYAKKSVSEQDVEKYTDAYNKAKSDLDVNAVQIQSQKSAIIAAKSNYERALSNIKEQEVQLQYYKISAPYSGIVGDIPVKIGNQVKQETQLLSITQNNPLELNVGLPAEKVFDIKNNLPVEILDNQGNTIEKSKITFVAPNVDTETQTVLTKAIISNNKGVLKSDQSVKVKVIFNQSPGVLVPTSAISHFGGQDFAYLLDKKGEQYFVKQLPVKLGDIQDNKYIVINGIKSGDMIVSTGIQKLMDGAPVSIISYRGNK